MLGRQCDSIFALCLSELNHPHRRMVFCLPPFWNGSKRRKKSVRNLKGIIGLLGLGLSLIGGKVAAQNASDFAVRVVDFANLGSGIYGDPSAVLGKPTTWIKELGNAPPVACSIVYGAWNVAPNDSKLLTTLGNGQQTGRIVVEFEPPITADTNHWYGKDFLVFGNAFFSADAVITAASNLNNVRVVSPVVFSEPVTISVSPDGVQWYTYSSPAADGYFPTQSYHWNAALSAFDTEQNWTKPVPSTVTPAMFSNQTVSDAIQLYDGSAGGTAFSLAASGFTSVRYIKAESRGGEVDGFARVGFSTTRVLGHILLQGLANTAPSQPMNFVFTNGSGDSFTRTASIGVQGEFILPDVPCQPYTVRIKGDRWLTKTLQITPNITEFPELNTELRAGDANNDNAIDIADLTLLVSHYNQAQGSGDYLDAADFDADGTNDIADLLLLISNYNAVGE